MYLLKQFLYSSLRISWIIVLMFLGFTFASLFIHTASPSFFDGYFQVLGEEGSLVGLFSLWAVVKGIVVSGLLVALFAIIVVIGLEWLQFREMRDIKILDRFCLGGFLTLILLSQFSWFFADSINNMFFTYIQSSYSVNFEIF